MKDNREKFLICQYRQKPKALRTIRALLYETSETFKNMMKVAEILSINDATGYALDLVGRHVGISRTLPKAIIKEYFGFIGEASNLAFGVGDFYRYGDALKASVRLSDDDYRFFIKAKIAKNYQDGTLENIIDSINFVMGKNCNVIDIQNMAMNLIVNSDNLNSLTFYAISKMDILARPIGVKYDYLVMSSNNPFGFAEDPEAKGFNMGTSVRLKEM